MADKGNPPGGNKGPNGNEEKKKKNPPPVAKTVKRKKKKGPANVVKIPTGTTNTNNMMLNFPVENNNSNLL